jgi:hypothetical protein
MCEEGDRSVDKLKATQYAFNHGRVTNRLVIAYRNRLRRHVANCEETECSAKHETN